MESAILHNLNLSGIDLNQTLFSAGALLLKWYSDIVQLGILARGEIENYIAQNIDLFRFYLPLGIIGIWRWSVWLFKETVALFYRPAKGYYRSRVSIVTPVYNEEPQVFGKALKSWAKNFPWEIIAVVDYTDKNCINVFNEFTQSYPRTKLIITKVPGKREALAAGIMASKSEIIALVDSDTIWDKNVIKNATIPFKNRDVGGVATRQNALSPRALAQKIFDTQLDLRYFDELPFLAAAGNALVCISGRTAFYRRGAIVPLLNELVNEKFLGEKVISGDDKRLTYLILKAGWKAAYQSTAVVFTPGVINLGSYLKQRLRWTRNSLRADIKAILEGWVFAHPALFFFQVDKVVQGFTLLVSPAFFFVSIFLGLWIPAGAIFVWWMVSRTVKIFPHLRRRPQDIVILPFFILFTFVAAVLKVYALFTLNTQGWLTRWDKSRLPKYNFIRKTPAYAASIMSIVLVFASVYLFKQMTLASAPDSPNNLISNESLKPSPSSDLLKRWGEFSSQPAITRYVTEPGDTTFSIAQKFEITQDDLLAANSRVLANWYAIDPGYALSIPKKNLNLYLPITFYYQIRRLPEIVTMWRNPITDTIEVFGRGKRITLKDVRERMGADVLEEVSPKVWHLKTSLKLHTGVMLALNPSEVTWLRLESNENKFVFLRVDSGVLEINGAKITSWNSQKNKVDENYNDGRSYILVKDGARMDIYNSELAYLGHPRTKPEDQSVYGVSMRMTPAKYPYSLLTGEVLNSKFHHNYFGAYTYGATSMIWRNNEFYKNARYGLDPHDDSNGFLVEDNKFYDNGTHGLIFSKRCINNIIRNNISYNNGLHGIMLHKDSNNNLIENNRVYENSDGIAIFASKNNLVLNNQVERNQTGIRIYGSSTNNYVRDNTFAKSAKYGVFLYDKSDKNIIKNNEITQSPRALYIKTSSNEIANNKVKNNRAGFFITGAAINNKLIDNLIEKNSSYGIYSKEVYGGVNYLNNNTIVKNKRNTYSI